MNRRQDELLPLEEAILDLGLKKKDSPDPYFYAYGMACELEETRRTPKLSSNGTMYKALRRMEELGWLSSHYEEAADAEADGKRPRRTLYEVTSAGAEAYLNAPRAVVRGAAEPRKKRAAARVGRVVALPGGAAP